MTSPRRPRLVAEPVADERRLRLVELGLWHGEWVAHHESSTPLAPAPADHNVHFVDVDAAPDAEDEFHRRAQQIMG